VDINVRVVTGTRLGCTLGCTLIMGGNQSTRGIPFDASGEGNP